MLAQYMAVDDNILKSMKKMDCDEIIDEIEELSENENCDICDVDEMWDALHFFLTKKSAFNPIKENRLSEAVIGKEKLANTNSIKEILKVTKYSELPEIIEALEKVDIDSLVKEQNLEEYDKAKIYPNRWKKAVAEDVFDEIVFCYEGLLDFYKRCYNKKLNIIISIY